MVFADNRHKNLVSISRFFTPLLNLLGLWLIFFLSSNIIQHFSQTETALNGNAAPFVPTESGDNGKHTYGTFTLKIPVDSKIWKDIAACSPPTRCFTSPRKTSPLRYSPSILRTCNLYPDVRISRALMTEVSPDGLISIRRKDNI